MPTCWATLKAETRGADNRTEVAMVLSHTEPRPTANLLFLIISLVPHLSIHEREGERSANNALLASEAKLIVPSPVLPRFLPKSVSFGI